MSETMIFYYINKQIKEVHYLKNNLVKTLVATSYQGYKTPLELSLLPGTFYSNAQNTQVSLCSTNIFKEAENTFATHENIMAVSINTILIKKNELTTYTYSISVIRLNFSPKLRKQT